MPKLRPISPCIWFDDRAEEAARFYTGLFDNARIVQTTHYPKEGHEVHGRPAGSVMTVRFEIEGQPFTLLNGGPNLKPTPGISFEVRCQTQAEIDRFWEKLSAGGNPEAQQCGWLEDRFGVSWQIVPTIMDELFEDPPTERTDRVMRAMLQMKKLDIAALKKAWDGDSPAWTPVSRSEESPRATR